MTQKGARALVELLRKRTVLWTTKIKGTEEHGLLLMIIRKIWPTLCSSVPLKMVVCKEDGPKVYIGRWWTSYGDIIFIISK